MKTRKEENKLYIGNRMIKAFNNKIKSIIEYPNSCIVLLTDEILPDNNVLAVDYNGRIIWDISKILPLKYPEAFVSISEENDHQFSIVSYNGVRFWVDILTNRVVRSEITK